MQFDTFIIFGGCGFIGTHTANLLRSKYPDAKIISHPECLPEVCSNSDFVGSTAGMLKFVKESDAKTFAVFRH